MTERDFRAFYNRNAVSFENFARVVARRHELNAQDFLAEAWMKAWLRFRKHELEEVEGYMMKYIFRCIANKAKKWFRRAKREAPVEEGFIDMEELTPLADAARMADMLDDVLSELPLDIEQAVRVCCLMDPPLAPSQAARALGCSVATMYRRLERARTELLQRFGELGLGFSF